MKLTDLKKEIKQFPTSNGVKKVRKILFGMKFTDGLFYKASVYLLLIALSYIYLYPMLYMVTGSFMSMEDIIDVAVKWIPSSLNFENYSIVFTEIAYLRSLLDAIYLAIVPAISATVSASLVGYGFAKFDFPFKKTLFVLMIMTFIVPPQITMLPMFRMFSQYNLLGSIRAFVYPAILAD